MGWVWRDEEGGSDEITNPFGRNPNPRGHSHGIDSISGDHCSTRKIITSNCRTEEVEPGKFVRKCERTEKILRDCFGKTAEVVQSNTEYTEDDVTQEVMKGTSIKDSTEMEPFDFPGLRSDIEAIERSLYGGVSRFFEAAEQMRDGFFCIFDDEHVSSGGLPSIKRGIPIDGGDNGSITTPKPKNSESGNFDLSGLAREV
ncbi:hypothetical protein Dimus_029945 [Dionaea muscipula]